MMQSLTHEWMDVPLLDADAHSAQLRWLLCDDDDVDTMSVESTNFVMKMDNSC